MGQYWEIVNVDKAQILHNHGGLKLEEMLASGMGVRLLNHLVKPQFEPLDDWKARITNIAEQKTILLSIPAEILAVIIGHLDESIDLICLALTCKSLWMGLQHLVRTCMTEYYACWAGDRIWIKGDYSDSYPSRLQMLVGSIPLCPDFETEGEVGSLGEFRECARTPNWYLLRNRLYSSQENAPWSSVEYDLFKQDARPSPRGCRSQSLFPPDKTWILRNLTTNSYISLDRILADAADVKTIHHMPFTRGLGDLLLYIAVWTDDPSGVLQEMKCDWAGCRFDVTVLDGILADTAETWTDVSNDFVWFKEELPRLLEYSARSQRKRGS